MSQSISSRPRILSARIVLTLIAVLALWSHPALAAIGPTSTLYITNYGEFSSGTICGLDLVQGVTINSYPTGNSVDICIAAAGDIRTMGYSGGDSGSRFALTGSPLPGGPFTNTLTGSQLHDGTSDGVYNYSVDYPTGSILRFTNTWSSPSTLFTVTPATAGWITMNALDGSFWLSQYGLSDLVEHRSASGTLLFSFTSGISGSQGLALDPIDGTLWLSQGSTLYQFTQTGLPIQSVSYSLSPQWYGMEFDTTPLLEPEPASGAIALVGVAMFLRRRRASSRR